MVGGTMSDPKIMMMAATSSLRSGSRTAVTVEATALVPPSKGT